MKKLFSILILATLFVGCSSIRSARISPGHAIAKADDVTANVIQSSDPKEPTTQQVESEESRVLPAGTVIENQVVIPATQTEPAKTNIQRTILAEPMPVSSRKVVSTKIGAAQKNTAAEVAAKLSSMRWIQWLGVLLVLFGGASLFYPPIKLVVNSVTTSTFCIVGGAGLIFLPIVIVGHELVLAGGAVGAALLWFFAHRHGGVQAELKVLKDMVVPKA